MGYLRINKLVIPRQMFDLVEPRAPSKESPHAGAHWSGWVAVAADENPDNDQLFAVWQDYRRRGFWVVPQQYDTTPVRLYVGEDTDALITAIVKLAQREAPSG